MVTNGRGEPRHGPGQPLIVDDDTAMRQMLESLFREQGYAVSEAQSADTALEMCRDAEYDVVLSDIKMPGKDGDRAAAGASRAAAGHTGGA